MSNTQKKRINQPKTYFQLHRTTYSIFRSCESAATDASLALIASPTPRKLFSRLISAQINHRLNTDRRWENMMPEDGQWSILLLLPFVDHTFRVGMQLHLMSLNKSLNRLPFKPLCLVVTLASLVQQQGILSADLVAIFTRGGAKLLALRLTITHCVWLVYFKIINGGAL